MNNLSKKVLLIVSISLIIVLSTFISYFVFFSLNNQTAYISYSYLSTEKIVKSTPKNNASQYSEEWIDLFNQKMEQLKVEFPSGKYWNHMGSNQDGIGVTSIPCNNNANGEKYCNHYQGESTIASGFDIGTQCAGFASLLSDRIFGADAPVRKFSNYDDIRIGDQARINNNSHTVFIINKTDEYVIVAECNADYKTCKINWGRKIMRSQLKGYYLTRWT